MKRSVRVPASKTDEAHEALKAHHARYYEPFSVPITDDRPGPVGLKGVPPKARKEPSPVQADHGYRAIPRSSLDRKIHGLVRSQQEESAKKENRMRNKALSPFLEVYGQLLRNARLSGENEATGKKWTLQEVAERARISTSHLSRIEVGAAEPGFVTAWLLAEVFEVPVHVMLHAASGEEEEIREKDLSQESRAGLQTNKGQLIERHAELIHELRKKNGWTLQDLSARCGVGPNYLGQIETSKVEPGICKVFRISKAFGLTVDEMLEIAGGAGVNIPIRTKLDWLEQAARNLVEAMAGCEPHAVSGLEDNDIRLTRSIR